MAGNKTLTKRYYERTIPVFLTLILLIFLRIKDYESYICGNGTLAMAIGIVLTAIVFFIQMRRKTEYSFINGLPINKQMQWKSFYNSVIMLSVEVYTAYVVIVVIQCNGLENILFWELCISAIVKLITTMFIATIVMWFMTHGIPDGARGALILGFVALFIAVLMVCLDVFYKNVAYRTNNILDILWNHWNIMTVPNSAIVEEINEWQYLDYYPNSTLIYKALFTGGYVLAITGITILVYYRSMKCYMKNELSKKMYGVMLPIPRGLIYGIVSLFFALCCAALSGKMNYHFMEEHVNFHGKLFRYSYYPLKADNKWTIIFWVSLAIGIAVGLLVSLLIKRLITKSEGGKKLEKTHFKKNIHS